jgi:DNA-binding MarR family transcriptional regulator
MNNKDRKMNGDLIAYQTARLKGLIGEIIQCCEDRKLYESQKFGLPYSELKCLMLFDRERYLTVKGIAERLDVAKSRVTKIIDGLIAKDLAERAEDPKDARIKLINLTPAGQKKSAEIKDFQMGIHRKLLLHLSASERKNVLSHLELLRAEMEAVKQQLV